MGGGGKAVVQGRGTDSPGKEAEMRYAVLAVLMGGVLFAQQTSPPAPTDGNDQQVEKLKKQNEMLKKEVERLRRELASLKAENEALKKESGLHKVTGQITVFNKKKKIGVVTVGSSAGLKGGEVIEIIRDGKCVGKMRVVTVFDENLSNARLLEGEAETGDVVVVWVRSVPGLEERLIAMEKRLGSLEEQIKRLIDVLSGMKMGTGEGQPKKEKPEQKAVVGKILMVVPKDEVVVLDVGKRDGVKKGDIFKVYRDGKPIAKVVVQDAIKEMARALILEKTLLPQKGDRVLKMKK